MDKHLPIFSYLWSHFKRLLCVAKVFALQYLLTTREGTFSPAHPREEYMSFLQDPSKKLKKNANKLGAEFVKVS